jgi:leucyl-tRNA synthetase
MGVPAHDTRDFKFAKENGLPIKVVIVEDEAIDGHELSEAFTEPGILVNSANFNGMNSEKAKPAIVAYAEDEGYGQARVQYRLRDWLISRQRYWGAPIPIIHCPDCGAVPVPADQLPVELPEDVEFSGKGSPLAQLESWVNVPCPTCGKPAKRETDTMDTFIDSSWYFLRYPDATNENAIFDLDTINDWMPVDQYVGGIEHAILHLLYSRFFTKVLRDRLGLKFDEPFTRLLTQGMVQGKTYKNPRTGKYVPAPEIADLSEPIDPETGEALEVFYEKMSKSKLNGVDPLQVLEKYGADTARMFVLFKAPPEKDLEWDDSDVEGQYRFLGRVWRLVTGFLDTETRETGDQSKIEKDLRRAVHTAIAEVSDDMQGEYQFNTAISELMKLSNALTDADCITSPVYREGIETLVKLLAPFAPHLADELWQQLGNSASVHLASWPELDPSALVVDEITLVIQVNGKFRGKLQAPASADKAELERLALASEVALKHLEGKEIRKTIVVPQKLVNFVVVG